MNDFDLTLPPCVHCPRADHCNGMCPKYQEWFRDAWRRVCQGLREIGMEEKR